MGTEGMEMSTDDDGGAPGSVLPVAMRPCRTVVELAAGARSSAASGTGLRNACRAPVPEPQAAQLAGRSPGTASPES